MSYTEINIIKKNGDCESYDEIRNSWRGAMAIWLRMEEKYLPEFIPDWAKRMPQFLYDEEGKPKKFYRMHQAPMDGVDKGKEIWELFNSDKVSRIDKIVLGSTFDRAVVMKENLLELIEAFENFDAVTSLKEQAEILKQIYNEEEAIGVCWNQTSVCQNRWTSYELVENDEDSDWMPYNIFQHDKHFNLFDDLK